MAERISARTLAEWAAFEEQFGPILLHERIDVAGALVAAALTGRPIEEVIPHWGGPRQQDPDEMWRAIEALGAKIGKVPT